MAMKMRAVLAATLICGSMAFGQFGPGAGLGGPGGPGGPGRGPRAFGGIRPGGGKLVTGAPYSATMTNTSSKILADGNTIERTTTGVVSRDSQGRTYSQETITMMGQTGTKTVTFISDPVAGYAYTLDATTMTAIRRALHPHTGAGVAGPGGQSKPWGGGEGLKAAHPGLEKPVAEDLGTQFMNGVSAKGTKMTHTIPAGQMGNTKALVSTTEVWKAADLGVVVYSKRTDPQMGTSTYALTNITKAEPASTLFSVPAGYTIKDAPAFGGGRPH